ncbi:glutathione-regulated potassium-efflux system protein KefC [archaeon BMS3Abin17]|nr:glutathione-regulated potassium-efflux system protein KefC [archaeon BMS3Abin17]HDZ60244.1 sodium:proton exchanger [Candidatus Pacearchaeota archaeon]
METVFIQLAIILFIAFVASFVVRSFKQPVIIGYIIAGMIIASILSLGYLDIADSQEIITLFSHFGIAFLLFIVGLHMNPRVIKEIGTSSLLIGLAQMGLTFVLTFLISLYILGFSVIVSSYVGIALMFSSTIIVMKLLSDKRQLDSLYGKISIGILIIQDLVAIGVLMFISTMSHGASLGSFALRGLLGGLGLILILFFIGYFVIHRAMIVIARSQELLFLFSICWCFVIAALFSFLGFSIEIGALVAGIVLSISPYSTEISSKIRPLRDFFLIIFFIILGLNIQILNISSIFLNAIILSLIALILKPIILMGLMAMFGYTKRSNFLVGTTLAQISEFSLIVLALGFTMGHLTGEVVSTLALTLVLTIILSTYMIIFSRSFYDKVSGFISFFEKKNIKKGRRIKKQYDAILFGYNRIGFSILNSLKKIKKNYLVVDYNPDTIVNLNKFKIPCIYGDLDDLELLRTLPLDKIQLAVSTIPDFDVNFLLIETIRVVNKDAIIIVRAHQIKDALNLYKKGASYVLTPHFLGGEYVAKMIREEKTSLKGYQEEKQKHMKMLFNILKKGQEHPQVEKN